MKQLSLILLTLLCFSATAQERAFQFYVPFRVDAGGSLSKLQKESDFGLVQTPAFAIEIMAGASVMYKHRIGLNVEGGIFLNTYSYDYKRSSYELGIWNPRTLATLFVNSNVINSYGSRLHLGLSYGFTYYSGASLTVDTDDMLIDTYESSGTAAIISPEIGLSQHEEKRRMDLLVTYTYQLDTDPNVRTRFTSEDGEEAVASTTLNKLALRVRYAILLQPNIAQKPPEPKPVVRKEVSKEFSERRTDQALDVKTRRKTVKLALRDNADEDGDVVSVSVNGVYVLENYELTKKKKTIRIPIRDGANSIVVYAHNEGRVPPNTATCMLKAGLLKEKVVLTTSLKRNQEIRVLRK